MMMDTRLFNSLRTPGWGLFVKQELKWEEMNKKEMSREEIDYKRNKSMDRVMNMWNALTDDQQKEYSDRAWVLNEKAFVSKLANPEYYEYFKDLVVARYGDKYRQNYIHRIYLNMMISNSKIP